jgi:uncharacterized protein
MVQSKITAMLRLKLWTIAVAVVLLCAASIGFCQDVKDLPKPTDYVSDLAHVMSPTVKQQLGLICGQIDHEAHAQIAVVTVKTTNGTPIGDYVVQLEEAWKVGPKSSDRGVIVLVAVNDRKRYISTGYGLESILPDSRVGQIGRQMVPMLRNNDFDGALTLAVDEISQIIAGDAGVRLTPLTRQGAAQAQQVHLSVGQLIVGAIFLLLIVVFLARAGGGGLLGFLLGMFLGGGGGRGGGGWGGGGGGGGGGGDGFGGFGGGSGGGGGAGGDW